MKIARELSDLVIYCRSVMFNLEKASRREPGILLCIFRCIIFQVETKWLKANGYATRGILGNSPYPILVSKRKKVNKFWGRGVWYFFLEAISLVRNIYAFPGTYEKLH